MVRTRLVAVAAVAALLAVRPASLAAQVTCSTNPCSHTNQNRVTVPTVVKLTLDASPDNASTTAFTNLTAPVEADLGAAAGVLNNGPTLTVKCNRSWTVTVKSATSAWGWTAPSGVTGLSDPSKSAGDLKWKISAGSFAAISTTAATMFSGTATASTAQQIFYKTLYNMTDVPGDYTLDVVFTVSAP